VEMGQRWKLRQSIKIALVLYGGSTLTAFTTRITSAILTLCNITQSQ